MGNRDTHIGRAVSSTLVSNGWNQTDLATALGASQSYVSQVLSGVRPANADWVNLVADVMQLQANQRVVLHRAAAKDHGFEIELPPPPKR